MVSCTLILYISRILKVSSIRALGNHCTFLEGPQEGHLLQSDLSLRQQHKSNHELCKHVCQIQKQHRDHLENCFHQNISKWSPTTTVLNLKEKREQGSLSFGHSRQLPKLHPCTWGQNLAALQTDFSTWSSHVQINKCFSIENQAAAAGTPVL